MKLINGFVALMFLLVTFGAFAEGGYSIPLYQVNQPVASKTVVFLVSAVLLKKGTTDGIRLIHGTVENKKDKDEALGVFVNKTLQDYPNYTVMTTVVTKLNFNVPLQPTTAMQCI